MNKMISGLLTLCLAAALATPALADNDKMHKGASTHASAMGRTMSMKCSPGKSWVKAYTKKNGTKVKGYCR